LLRRSDLKLKVVSQNLTSSIESWQAVAEAERLKARKARGGIVFGTLAALLLGGVAGYYLAK
jgi:hypothetical protein